MITKPLKWHGGKHYSAKRIVKLMPAHTHYVEPFFGGGSVLFAKPFDHVSEVVNDINGELTNFWHVLRSPELFDRFYRIIEATPFCEAIWRDAGNCASGDPAGRAVAFFVRCRQCRQGLCRDFATVVKRRLRNAMNENVSAWLTAVAGLPSVHQRLKRVLILNRAALDVIRQQDGPQTLFYLDPPYLHETRSSVGEYGQHEMTEADHVGLLNLLAGIRGAFILSGYPSRLYEQHAARHGWSSTSWQLPNQASSRKAKELRMETVWLNFTPNRHRKGEWK
jgi:DNA adenine methylase